MTTAEALAGSQRPDALTGNRSGFLDRWIYAITAGIFIAVVLTGFIPDSQGLLAAVKAGERPPIPPILHAHAALMGTYLILLLAQTVMVATGRVALHRQVGVAGMVLAAALVVVGFTLVPVMYHQTLDGLKAAPPAAKAQLEFLVGFRENVLLIQGRIGIVFAILVYLGLRARQTDSGFHKRMMILSIAPALPAGFDRIKWIWTTMPASPVSPDVYVLAAIAPLFLWDVIRNRGVHRAYWVWLAVCAPFTVAVHLLWDKPYWHALAKQILGG